MNSIQTVCLAAIMTTSLTCFAGHDRGGDKGVVCRDANHQITLAETLDLFEARELFGLKVKDTETTLQGSIELMKKRLMQTQDQPDLHLFPEISYVQKIMHRVGPGVIIKPIDDAAEVAVPANCAVEQLASYIDEDLLLVSDEIWQKLSIADQTALILHEAIYRSERYYGATDSRRTRKIVGHLLADFAFVAVREGIPANARYCSASMPNAQT